MENFDIVIIGAGSAGCIVANQLISKTNNKILLIEAGPSDKNPIIKIPLGYGMTFYNKKINWNFYSEKQNNLFKRQIYYPRGKVLGGSGSINAMVYARGLETDYEIDNLITTLTINGDSPLIGKAIQDTFLFKDTDVTLLKLIRDRVVTNAPGKYITLAENDRLVVMADLENIERISAEEHLTQRALRSKKEQTEDTKVADKDKLDTKRDKQEIQLVEVLVLPGSAFIGNTLNNLKRLKLEGALPIAIKKRKNIRNTTERLIRKDLNQILAS